MNTQQIIAPAVADLAADLTATLAADGFSPAEIDAILAWKPFCPFEGCVCEKHADCAYCEACTGAETAASQAYAVWLDGEIERERVEGMTLGAFMFGEPSEDDRYDW